jgi:hypothetical protein
LLPSDDELRSVAKEQGAIAAMKLFERRSDGYLPSFVFISFFRRVFPEIPLTVLLKACDWKELSGAGESDDFFSSLMDPWVRDSHASGN